MLIVSYAALVFILSLYGLHRLALASVWLWTRNRPPQVPTLTGDLPFVTVQLPVFNERDVVSRLLDAVAALDWPADRFEIQLLDDSTDDTAYCASAAVQRARARGIETRVLHRSDRTGYKAGALAAGLATARGDLVAIFDADFVPAPDFLRALVPHFSDGNVGMVQARWGHLNADGSALTRAQAVLLDGHFVIEHVARNRGGAWFNFNGTAGIWRRAAIDAAGGWQHDTLTEDLDLSYRAQLAGWRFVYRVDHVVPAELPDTLGGFRSQQRRWAKGSMETARKLRWRILTAPVSIKTKLEALFHLHANLSWPLALTLAVLLPAVVLFGPASNWSRHLLVDLPGFILATSGNVVFYALGQRRGHRNRVVLAMLLAIGITVSQTAAVLDAWTGRRSPFVRTPKRGEGAGSYRPQPARTAPYELALAMWHLGAAVMVLATAPERWGSIPFLLLFGGGFAWVGGAGFVEAYAARRAHVRATETALAAK